ncbi:MAG TPA: hypothetical protein VET90_08140, partial [Candidatus Binatus sp.]|nr:hypothetical protein [Candidatus Binatus sp.]
VQYGFEPQRDDLRSLAGFWGPGSLVGPDGRTVSISPAWGAAWRFFYDGMWGSQPFIMTGQVFGTDAFNGGGYPFFSGKVAMSENFLWSTFGVAAAGTGWNLAAVPTHDGTVAPPLDVDTFAIPKASPNPGAAFAALTYLLGEGSSQLLGTYAAMPARPDRQDAFLAQLGQTDGFPRSVDWQVVTDSLARADDHGFQAWTPADQQTGNILDKYLGRWTTTPGLDMDTELANLAKEIQAQWNG